jgi:spore coat polysaccharide biosynthesis predicted glycosyltransferase SpsG
MAAPIEISWLHEAVSAAAIVLHVCAPDELPLEAIRRLDVDWLVVDSYRIDSAAISAATEFVSVLAIVDGETRNIRADLYLDQNLGAEDAIVSGCAEQYLLGANYALVRNEIIQGRREEPWRIRHLPAKVLCFMGGTDPKGAVLDVLSVLYEVADVVELTIVAAEPWRSHLDSGVKDGRMVRVIAPTKALPSLMAAADVVISAAGTSAWDICTLGIPAILVALVDNQQASLHEAVHRGLALGVDAVAEGPAAMTLVKDMLLLLLSDAALRESLSRAATSVFDGCGTARVVEALEKHAPRRV